MKRILVTGGAGFIGSCVVRRLLAAGNMVVTVDLLTYAGHAETLGTALDAPNHRFEHADIRDRRAVRRIMALARPHAVIHLAAESHVDRSIDSPMDFVTTNVQGTVTLLEAATDYWGGLENAARRRFRFLHVSTDEVYGSLGNDGAFTDTTPYRPNSPYAASKAASDHFARAWHRTFGLPVVISHCSNNYGPYQMPEKLVPVVIVAALEGRPIPVYGDGENVRDWLFVEDHARALELILERGTPGEVYNVGADAEMTNIRSRAGDLRSDGRADARKSPPSPRRSHRIRRRSPGTRPPLRPRFQPHAPRAGMAARRRSAARPGPSPCAGISRTAGGGRESATADSKTAGDRVCGSGDLNRCVGGCCCSVRMVSLGTTFVARTRNRESPSTSFPSRARR